VCRVYYSDDNTMATMHVCNAMQCVLLLMQILLKWYSIILLMQYTEAVLLFNAILILNINIFYY